MVFLRSPFSPELPPALAGWRVSLRVPQVGDYDAWAALRIESRAFLAPWEPSWPPDDVTRGAFRSRIKRYLHDIEDDAAYPFFIFRTEDQALLGALTISNVRRGVAQMASIGYWIGRNYARQGYMTAAVNTVLPFAFDHLRHQIHIISNLLVDESKLPLEQQYREASEEIRRLERLLRTPIEMPPLSSGKEATTVRSNIEKSEYLKAVEVAGFLT